MKKIRDTRRAIDKREYKGRVNHPSSVAFTLTELLVVIAALAALAAILVPRLQSAILRGREIECRNNLKQLGAAELLYLADNGRNMFPYQPNTWIPTLESVFPAMTNVLICPLTAVQTPPPGENTAGAYNLAWVVYMNNPGGLSSVNGSYTLNGYLYGSAGYGDSASYVKDSDVLYPAQTPAFEDGAWVDA